MKEDVMSFRDLRIWQRAMDLVPKIYCLARSFPSYERFGLADQIRRATVSIASNIAEGHARRHTREFLQHLSIARGSLAEVHTLLLLAERLEYITSERLKVLEKEFTDLRMPLYGLISRLKARL